MTTSEEYLIDHICSNCHAAILEPHPEEKFRIQNYVKCVICGMSKQLPKNILQVHKIIYGNKKPN